MAKKIQMMSHDKEWQVVDGVEVISYVGHYYDATLGGDRMRHYYRVHCDCGTSKIVQRGQLTSEIVHSCGCGRRGRR